MVTEIPSNPPPLSTEAVCRKSTGGPRPAEGPGR
jgi:hypothetical protein